MRSFTVFIIAQLLPYSLVIAQSQQLNPAPALNFLRIEPDARSSGMGATGAATTADNFSVFHNPGKLAMIPEEYGMSVGYVPWVSKLVKGVGMATAEGFRKMDEQTAIGLDLRFFSLGKIQFKDETGYDIFSYNPTEWTIGLTYSRQLSEYAAIGLTFRYINSRPALGIQYAGQEIKSASAIGGDIGYYYSNVAFSELESYTGGILRLGLALQNLGSKVKYHEQGGSAFQPMLFRGGLSYTFPSEGREHLITISADLNKLLVPPPPVRDDNGNIISGKDPEQTNVPAAFFAGWSYMKTWGAGAGLEYLYHQQFYIRAGAYYESPDFSVKQLGTLGVGFLLGAFHADMSYYTALGQQAGVTNYQAQTFKVSLGITMFSK